MKETLVILVALLVLCGCSKKESPLESFLDREDYKNEVYASGSAEEVERALINFSIYLENLTINEREEIFVDSGFDLYRFINFAELAMLYEAKEEYELSRVVFDQAIFYYLRYIRLEGVDEKILDPHDMVRFQINVSDLERTIKWREELDYTVPDGTRARLYPKIEPGAVVNASAAASSSENHLHD